MKKKFMSDMRSAATTIVVGGGLILAASIMSGVNLFISFSLVISLS